jgi:putative nucleotidyltransferase with HDIG domain
MSRITSLNSRSAAVSQTRAAGFVLAVIVCAVLMACILYRIDPSVREGSVSAVLVLGILALMGEAWQFMLPRSAVASIAFIPYAAMALVVPNWVVLAAIAAAKFIEASLSRRSVLKSAFNIALFVLMFACTILAYRAMGGTAFLPADGMEARSFASMTRANGIAALIAFCVSFAVNMLLLSTVIALHSGRTVRAVWRENHLSGMGLEMIAAPVVFLFGWVYVAHGAIAAALVWVPILGYRHTIKTSLDLEQTNRELLELMIKSIEARDPYTSGHSRRVQHYAMLIARALGLTEREVEHVSTSALLHDVGKIHEKYGKILTKEDKLSPDEWSLMREHPIDGANLVATMTRLHQFVAPVRHHHENWNGTGYPDGLAGDRIPLASRIIMFADTIDAMTTARPYRGPLGEEVVRAEIIRRRGEQFDPAIADAILSSPVWRHLFVPSHPATRGHEIALAANPTETFQFPGRRMARQFARRVANET